MSSIEQDTSTGEHDGLSQHHGQRLQSHAGDTVSYDITAQPFTHVHIFNQLPTRTTWTTTAWLKSVCVHVPSSFRDYTSRFSSEDTLLFCMRVMVGVIILYDHVHPNGAFNKSSKIDVRLTCTWLKLQEKFNSVALFCNAVVTLFISSDERMHKGPEGPAGRQRRRPAECPQVGHFI